MNKVLPTLLISWSLALLSPSKALWNEKISNNSIEVQNRTIQILQSENKDFSKILDEKLNQFNIDNQTKQEIKDVFNDENFKKELFSILKKEKTWVIESIVLALILWFLYGYAYFETVKRVKKDAMPIAVWSFAIFSLTSWWMVLINWFVPWSLVYFESFLLAWYVVYLHLKNKKEWKIQKFENFSEFIEENPLPVVRYNKEWKPILWNKRMEEETWYSYEEILEYYEKHWEVMRLLYKWKNLEKVKKYLDKIAKTWVLYKNIAFTMTTKYWEEKTFLWTTMSDWLGWTIRTARLLTNEAEIKQELQRTKALLNNTYKEIDKKDDKELLEKLDEAIIEDRIVPFFQPIFYTNDTSRIYKYEVLMRVKTKDWKFEAPFQYLEIAKKYNRLVAIFNIIFTKVFKKASTRCDLEFSINLSGQDIVNPDLIQILTNWTEVYGVDPSRITLEILEWEWNGDFDHIDVITKIKSKRFRIAMDDFGLDNSNLNRLLDLLNNKQIDELKIDWHIIKYLIDKEKWLKDENVKLSTLTKEILRWLINACHKAWVLVIAEYIENDEILQECRDLEIDFLQWFHLSKPLEDI